MHGKTVLITGATDGIGKQTGMARAIYGILKEIRAADSGRVIEIVFRGEPVSVATSA